MIEAFKPGTLVRKKGGEHGTPCKITDTKRSWDWNIPGYLGEGFYEIEVIGCGKKFVLHEDDIETIPPEEELQ